jgi:glycosyltransferase involved in cell wall biosynthesis
MVEKQLPLVSVIMPIRNEADFIERAIGSVLGNDYPSDMLELLVIDGMSDDGTRQIVKTISRQDARVKLYDNTNRIVPFAMNIGLAAMKGDLFTRVDGHAEVAPDFIRNSVAVLLEKEGA